jgi:hypothetical protein
MRRFSCFSASVHELQVAIRCQRNLTFPRLWLFIVAGSVCRDGRFCGCNDDLIETADEISRTV